MQLRIRNAIRDMKLNKVSVYDVNSAHVIILYVFIVYIIPCSFKYNTRSNQLKKICIMGFFIEYLRSYNIVVTNTAI